MINKRIKSATLFPNGMIMVFGTDGEQIPELQGAYSLDLHKRILLEAIDNAVIRGFDILPYGFVKHAEDWLEQWNPEGKTWEEIQELCGNVDNKPTVNEDANENANTGSDIDTHKLKSVLSTLEDELEKSSEGIGQAKWEGNQLNEFYNNGKHEAFEIAVSKLKPFFETNNIEIKSE